MGLFGKKKVPQQPLDRPPPLGDLVAPEPPPKSPQQTYQQRPLLGDIKDSPFPEDFSLPSLEEEFKPLTAESFGLPTLGEEKFPDTAYTQKQSPLFPEIPPVKQQMRETLSPPPLPQRKTTIPVQVPAREDVEHGQFIVGRDHFMNLQDYTRTQTWLEHIDQNTDVGEDTVYRLNELDQEADKYYQRLITNLELIQRKILTIDRTLFKG